MKHIFLFTLLLLATSAFSQDTLHTVSGMLQDNKGQKTEQATVTLCKLPDSVVVKSALTNSLGQFTFKNLAPGTYIIRVNAMGYDKYISSSFFSKANHNIGTIILAAGSKALQEVTVRSQKPLIEQKVDRLVMNIENSILAAGNNALELLEQAPFVSVDENGNVTLKGIQGATVMIDGKPSYLSASDLTNLLKNMQASQVASIEIITNPSSKYDASGNGGIVNIKMKKNQTVGLTGSLNSSLQQGRLPRLTNGLNLNYRKGRVNLYSTINHSLIRGWSDEVSDLIFFDRVSGASQSRFQVNENMVYRSTSASVRAGMDYSVSKKTTLGILFNGSSGAETQTALNENKVHSFSPLIDSSLLTTSSSESDWSRYSWNLNLRHEFDSTGRLLTVDVDYADFDDQSRPDYVTDYYTATGNKTATTYLSANMGTAIKMASVKADYEQALPGAVNFGAGIKWSRVQTFNSVNYFRNGLFDKNRSNDFDYVETINAGYVELAKEFKKLSIKMGLRAEQTISGGNQLTQNSLFSRKYIQIFPTTLLRYKWNKDHSSGISINRRIGRPDYESLNPFIYLSDPYNSWGGNPYLLPSVTQSAEISHNYKGGINFFISYSQTNNALSRTQIKDSLSSGIFSTWENLGKSRQIAAGIGTFLKVNKWWRMNNNLFVFNTVSSGQLGDMMASSSVFSYRIFTNSNFTLSKKLSAEMNAWYRPASLWGVSKTGPLGSVSAGMQVKILNDEGSVKISVNDIFRTMRMNTISLYSGVDSRYRAMSETQAIRLSFNYRFGRKQVKSERERETALEDESSRTKSRG